MPSERGRILQYFNITHSLTVLDTCGPYNGSHWKTADCTTVS